jgi:hypothetical protein
MQTKGDQIGRSRDGQLFHDHPGRLSSRYFGGKAGPPQLLGCTLKFDEMPGLIVVIGTSEQQNLPVFGDLLA